MKKWLRGAGERAWGEVKPQRSSRPLRFGGGNLGVEGHGFACEKVTVGGQVEAGGGIGGRGF